MTSFYVPSSVIKTAALYIRVSTHDQEELSPDSQKRLLLEYARANEITVPEEFIFQEKGISGRKAEKRPQFQQMIAQAKSSSHPFDAILVWKFSRFARNQEESIVYKSMLRNKYQVYVVSISEPLADGPFGSLIERIIEWMDEFYSIRLSGDVTRGMTEKALRGGYQCQPPLGYCLPSPGADLKPVPEEARIISQIFSWYAQEGLTLSDIALRLNSAGIRTRRGNLFDRRSLSYILQNPLYAGKIRWNRLDSSSHTVRDPSQWILSSGNHPPIVSKELFQQAVSRLESVSPSVDAPSRRASVSRHWLGGILKCPECGKTLSSCIRHRKTMPDTVYFQCTDYLKGKCSCNCYTSEASICSAVLKALESADFASSSSLQFQVSLPASASVSPPSGGAPEYRQESLLQQLRTLKQQEQRAKNAYLSGTDSLEEYTRTKKALKREHSQIESALNRTKLPEEPENRCMVPQTLCQLLTSEHYTNEQKNTALKSVVKKVVFYKKECRIDLYFLSPL